MKSTFRKVWEIPVIIGIFSLIGLLTALVGDGLYDLLSWILLGIPVLIIIWFVPWFKTKKNAIRK